MFDMKFNTTIDTEVSEGSGAWVIAIHAWNPASVRFIQTDNWEVMFSDIIRIFSQDDNILRIRVGAAIIKRGVFRG